MSADFSDEVRDLMHRLDHALPPQDQPGGPADSGPVQDGDRLVETAQRLAQGPRVTLAPAAQDRIEARLRARVAELHGATTSPEPAPRSAIPTRDAVGRVRRGTLRGWRALAAALLVIVAVGLIGAARVSAASLPGEPLYPLKRAIEGARLVLSSGDAEVGLRLDFAEERIEEFEALLENGRVYVPTLTDAVDDLGTAADLLAEGHGDPSEAQTRVERLVGREAALLAQAEPLASQAEWVRLQAHAADSTAIQTQIEALIPLSLPETPPATPTSTPTSTPTATPSSTATSTPTPTLKPQASGGEAATGTEPTRTPPGHGPTPGLGQNSPGQGGANPGIGNGGNPPGQQKSTDDSANNKRGN